MPKSISPSQTDVDSPFRSPWQKRAISPVNLTQQFATSVKAKKRMLSEPQGVGHTPTCTAGVFCLQSPNRRCPSPCSTPQVKRNPKLENGTCLEKGCSLSISPASPLARKRLRKLTDSRCPGKTPIPVSSPSPVVKEISDTDVFDDICCKSCSSPTSHDDNAIILCDGCDAGYHQRCLRPVLRRIPRGKWICPSCRHNEKENNMPLQIRNSSRNNKQHSLKRPGKRLYPCKKLRHARFMLDLEAVCEDEESEEEDDDSQLNRDLSGFIARDDEEIAFSQSSTSPCSQNTMGAFYRQSLLSQSLPGNTLFNVKKFSRNEQHLPPC